LAHSGRFAIYAFAVGCELGIDIEEIKRIADQENIVRRFFSREECEEWLELDASQRDGGFFRCWTRKEAYIKAVGGGLSIPLDGFRVSLRPGVPAQLIHADGDSGAAARWRLCSLTPVDGYVGALAFADQVRDVAILPRLSATEVLELVNGTEPFPPAAKEPIPCHTPQSHT
jgi:4'-phosphopantetheinyl transferase